MSTINQVISLNKKHKVKLRKAPALVKTPQKNIKKGIPYYNSG